MCGWCWWWRTDEELLRKINHDTCDAVERVPRAVVLSSRPVRRPTLRGLRADLRARRGQVTVTGRCAAAALTRLWKQVGIHQRLKGSTMDVPARAGRDRAVITGWAGPGAGKSAVRSRSSRGSGRQLPARPRRRPPAPAPGPLGRDPAVRHRRQRPHASSRAAPPGSAGNTRGGGGMNRARSCPLEALLAVRQITPRGPRHWPQAVGRDWIQSGDAGVHRHRYTREPADLNQRKANSA